MPLTQIQLDHVRRQLNKHYTACSVCGDTSQPQIADAFGAITTWEEKGGRGMQIVTAVCLKCGQIILFRAQSLGLQS